MAFTPEQLEAAGVAALNFYNPNPAYLKSIWDWRPKPNWRELYEQKPEQTTMGDENKEPRDFSRHGLPESRPLHGAAHQLG